MGMKKQQPQLSEASSAGIRGKTTPGVPIWKQAAKYGGHSRTWNPIFLKIDPRNSKILTDRPKYANRMEFKSKFDSSSNVKIFSFLDNLPMIDEEFWKCNQSLISAQSPPTL